MKRLVVIDGHAILHRAFHALPPLSTSKGEVVNAVYGFVSILLRVMEELKPTHLTVVFDTPKPTFRNKLSSDYQATRPKTDEKLIGQFDLAHRVVEEMGILHFEMDGYEADDVIGTIVRKLKTEKVESIIVTGDKDLMQLVDEYIKLYMPVKGMSVSKLYLVKDVEEKLGVKPKDVVDLKALIGDQSDNYPGVSGIGPKTAVELLRSWGSFEGIYKHLEEIKSKTVKEKLVNGKKDGELSKKLATIETEVPIDFKLDDCKFDTFDTPQVRWMLEELEFKSLIPRLSSNNRQQITDNRQQKPEKEKESTIHQASLF